VIRPSRDLGHVHKRLQTRLLPGGGERGRRLEQAIGDRIGEVRTFHAVQRGTQRLGIADIADGDFGAELPELIGPMINLTNKSPNRKLLREQLPSDMVARGPMTSASADHQETCHSTSSSSESNRSLNTEAAASPNSSA
jgi:hypothetical protein